VECLNVLYAKADAALLDSHHNVGT